MELAGKAALVTGSAGRIGPAIATALARAGADVIVHYNRSAEAAGEIADDICRLGVKARTIQADLADPAAIEAMFAALAEPPGRLDVLVNNAAIFEPTPIEALTAQQWDRHFAVNARAAALCIRHALPLMRSAGGGAIVNVTDVGAEKGWPGYPAYCASKAALLALTKSAARALAGDNIRVNAVAPGLATWGDDVTEQDKQHILAQVPLRRAGTPDDVAAAVVFLARHDYITGQNLRIDGGSCMG